MEGNRKWRMLHAKDKLLLLSFLMGRQTRPDTMKCHFLLQTVGVKAQTSKFLELTFWN